MWAIDDVFLDEKCLDMCNGRGDCIRGSCVCDIGTEGTPLSLLSLFYNVIDTYFDKFISYQTGDKYITVKYY